MQQFWLFRTDLASLNIFLFSYTCFLMTDWKILIEVIYEYSGEDSIKLVCLKSLLVSWTIDSDLDYGFLVVMSFTLKTFCPRNSNTWFTYILRTLSNMKGHQILPRQHSLWDRHATILLYLFHWLFPWRTHL